MRIYGRWASNPKGIPEDLSRCIAEMGDGFIVLFHQCYHERGHGSDGLYCWHHARMIEDKQPVHVGEKDDER